MVGDRKRAEREINRIMDHPLKLRILNHLKRNHESSLGNIIQDLGISVNKGLRHVIELKHLGLIQYNDQKRSFLIPKDQEPLTEYILDHA